MSLIHLNIDGKEVVGRAGQTILQIARENNIDIPTLCFDEKVEIYGSCGLCVVEVEGNPKLLRSCATMASEGMVVTTNSDRVLSSRKNTLELLLSDHTGDCRPPCVLACPGNTDCQGYVGLAANMEFKEGLKLIKEQLPLPASIGRVCPHPCEDACRRQLVEEPVSIAHMKAFLADLDLNSEDVFIPEIPAPTGKKVAVIGGGPGGLSCAYFLRTYGHEVDIYDQMPQMGGMLRYGIPEYRLPSHVIDKEIEIIEKMGVKMINNIKIGRDLDLNFVRNNYDAVYISIGAWKSSSLRVPGEELEGVMGGIDFLRKVTINEPLAIGNRVAVVGGGNTAMDAARTAVRLGAKEVYVLYRRTEAEMPAEEIEIKEAREEGVEFKFLVAPLEIIGENGKATKIKLQKMMLGEEDASGRRKPIPIEGEFEFIDIDLVIGAIGQESSLEGFEIIEKTRKGTIAADENAFTTNVEGVFAGGDVINQGANIAIKAIGDAKKASNVINSFLEGYLVPYRKPYVVERKDFSKEDVKDKEIKYRSKMRHLSAEERKDNFREVNLGFSVEEAVEDAKRCLECGCHDYFECKLYKYANEYDVEPEKYDGEKHHREEKDNHPFIVRNADKCILCGLCVRICDQVMDNGALGLVNRGFDTIVKPSMELDLAETSCISCGQCVAACPVGALQERLQIEKSVPVETEETKTICSYCSVGCNINLNTRGNMLYRALPEEDSEVDNGLLCAKGRFGYNIAKQNKRLVNPLLKMNGEFKETTFEEALLVTAKKLQSTRAKYGADSIAIAISDRYTNEEIYLAKKLAKDILKTDNVTSFNRNYGGIEEVIGVDASTSTFSELENADFILAVGTNMMKNHTIAALKVKNAVENGAKLVTINDSYDQINDWANINITPENNLNILKQILKAIIDLGYEPKNAVGFIELKESLNGITVNEDIANLAKEYTSSKKAIIVFDENNITSESERLIASIAVVSGQIGKARRGIIQLKPKNNSQGLADLRIDKPNAEIKNMIENNTIKAMLILGEDIEGLPLEKLEFLAVCDLYMTSTAQKADCVIPAVSYAESKGTFTNSERRIQKLYQAIPALSGHQNWEIIYIMMQILGYSKKYNSVDEITIEMAREAYNYYGFKEFEESVIWPLNNDEVFLHDGFMFEDKKAKLKAVEDAKLFEPKGTTDYVEKEFKEKYGAIC
jgi:formate dehydrogenase major subunit